MGFENALPRTASNVFRAGPGQTYDGGETPANAVADACTAITASRPSYDVPTITLLDTIEDGDTVTITSESSTQIYTFKTVLTEPAVDGEVLLTGVPETDGTALYNAIVALQPTVPVNGGATADILIITDNRDLMPSALAVLSFGNTAATSAPTHITITTATSISDPRVPAVLEVYTGAYGAVDLPYNVAEVGIGQVTQGATTGHLSNTVENVTCDSLATVTLSSGFVVIPFEFDCTVTTETVDTYVFEAGGHELVLADANTIVHGFLVRTGTPGGTAVGTKTIQVALGGAGGDPNAEGGKDILVLSSEFTDTTGQHGDQPSDYAAGWVATWMDIGGLYCPSTGTVAPYLNYRAKAGAGLEAVGTVTCTVQVLVFVDRLPAMPA